MSAQVEPEAREEVRPEVRREQRRSVAASVRSTLRGGQPEEDDRFRADDGDGQFIRSLAWEAARVLEDRPAEKVLEWAAAVVPRFVVTSSFGAESIVLLDMVSRVAPQVPVLFLDTGLHFDATLGYRQQLADELGLTVVDVRPDRSVEQQARDEGPELWNRDPDRCCQLRKTAPLRAALRNYDGWATGVRRSQTRERASTPLVEARRHAERWLVKVAPIAPWTDADTAAYLRARDLDPHPMVAQGYASIGCSPCTAPVADGQDPRAGRWTQTPDKDECGLHLADDGRLVRATTTPG